VAGGRAGSGGDEGSELVAVHCSSLYFNNFTAQLLQAFGEITIIVFSIDRTADGLFGQVGIQRVNIVTIAFAVPPGSGW